MSMMKLPKLLLIFLLPQVAVAQGPYQATGIKIGEVSQTEAIIWTRTTLNEYPNPPADVNPEIQCTSTNRRILSPPSKAQRIRSFSDRVRGVRSTGSNGRGLSIRRKLAKMKTGCKKCNSCCLKEGEQVSKVINGEGESVQDLDFGVPGTMGETRVLYRRITGGGSYSDFSPKPKPSGKKRNGKKQNWVRWEATEWGPVSQDKDFTRHVSLRGLKPGSQYEIKVEARAVSSSYVSSTEMGKFFTAAPENMKSRVVFTVVSCQQFQDQDSVNGFQVYERMLDLKPSFFVHTGDILYYDREPRAVTPELARYKWNRLYGLPSNIMFHRRVASYFMKDDHDTWINDCYPGLNTDCDQYKFQFEDGQAMFLEQVPMGERTYRTRRWGKDLQIWMVEGRDFRSPNDQQDGPDKTIWGREQFEWLKRSIRSSDAAFRILISPTCIIGPDVNPTTRTDNHADTVWEYEGNLIREFLVEENVHVINGDRHWQYASILPQTTVHEYGCGAMTDVHAGQWNPDQDDMGYHQYVKIIGGFLSVTVERIWGKPTATFRFHNVSGEVEFEDQLWA